MRCSPTRATARTWTRGTGHLDRAARQDPHLATAGRPGRGPPGLALGFAVDDYFHLYLLDQEGLDAAWTLFDFADGDPATLRPSVEQGPYPWYSLDELELRFLRPLTGLLAWAEHATFGREVLPLHLHSFAWYLGGWPL